MEQVCLGVGDDALVGPFWPSACTVRGPGAPCQLRRVRALHSRSMCRISAGYTTR
jgi:hypothetical protein